MLPYSNLEKKLQCFLFCFVFFVIQMCKGEVGKYANFCGQKISIVNSVVMFKANQADFCSISGGLFA